MTRSNLFLSAVMALFISMSGHAAVFNPSDSLTKSLADAETPADSISLLYNIFDCSTAKKQEAVLEDIYRIASRTGDYDTALDALRLRANMGVTSDSLLNALIQRAEAIPENDNKKATMLFIKVRNNTRLIRSLPEEVRDNRLRECLSKYKEADTLDNYDRIEYLFTLCAFLRLNTDGDLLMDYFSKLQELIDALPSRELFLRSLFYVQASVGYVSNDMYEQAVEANRTLLDIIAEMEKKYKASGRVYRNYSRQKYFCYSRLLRCYSALTGDEIDTYYENLLAEVNADEAVKNDFNSRRRPEIYYLMAKKHYQEAITLITQQLKDKTNTPEEYRYLVESLIEAADAVGDNVNLLAALRINNRLLKDRIIQKAAESYKELQTVYEVYDLKQKNDELTMANQQILIERHRDEMLYAGIGFFVLIVLLVVLSVYYRRAKRLSANLTASNSVLANERDVLKRAQKNLIEARDRAKTADRIKTDFVNDMSHEIRTPLAAIVEYSRLISDCAEDDKRDYIKRFADIISLNSDMLLTLVNDVLDLPSIESARLSVRMAPTSVNRICKAAVDSVKNYLKYGVVISFVNDGEPDTTIITDPHRLEQILQNLLINAAKFTDKGSVKLEYSLIDDRRKIRFTVTDTGIGIPRGQEDSVFERFSKLNPSTQGNGLGLYISRLLARILKGELTVDSEYRKGARLVLTIPVNDSEVKA